MRYWIVFIGMIISTTAFSQEKKEAKFSFYGTAGPNFYINNFEQFKKFVDPVNYSLGVRVVWEPGHRLSVGLKSGYVRVYSVNFTGQNSGKFILTAVPIQLFFSMKLVKGFYVFTGLGPTLFYNKISSSSGELLNSTFTSLADFTGGLGYVWKLKSKISVGLEVEYLHSAKSDENLISTVAVVRVPFSIF